MRMLALGFILLATAANAEPPQPSWGPPDVHPRSYQYYPHSWPHPHEIENRDVRAPGFGGPKQLQPPSLPQMWHGQQGWQSWEPWK
jgi:hypothetical protein